MHRSGKFLGQRGMDTALAFDSRHAFERGRHDADMEMSLALAAVIARGAAMARMAGALVIHLQRGWRESGR